MPWLIAPYPPPIDSRKLAKLALPAFIMAALATSACITAIDDPEDVDACNVGDGCNGVELFCYNGNFAPANDGGNYWYDKLEKSKCEAENGLPYETSSGWYCQLGNQVDIEQGSIKRCVEAEDGFDPNGTGFNEDGFPELDDEVKEMSGSGTGVDDTEPLFG